MNKPVELQAGEVAVYTVQEDGSLTSLSEKYPLVDPHLYARVTVFVDMEAHPRDVARDLAELRTAILYEADFFVSEPRPEPFHIEE